LSVGCGVGLREAEVPTPALLIVDLRFSIARASLDFQSKVASRNRRKYWPGIFFSVSASLGHDHHQMKMIVHQAIGMHLSPRFETRLTERAQKLLPLGIMVKNRFAL
jgi:hypothetical protein